MAKLTQSRAAQTPLVQEYVFSFGDTVVDTAGADKDFKTFGGNPVFPMFRLPVGAVISGGDIIVETAYAGTTVATISIGDSGSATKYASAVNMMAAANTRTALALTAAISGGLDVIGTLALTVANATAGKVRVRIEYTIEGRSNEVA